MLRVWPYLVLTVLTACGTLTPLTPPLKPLPAHLVPPSPPGFPATPFTAVIKSSESKPGLLAVPSPSSVPVSSNRVSSLNALAQVWTQIPAPLQTNKWVKLTFPTNGGNFTVYAKDQLDPSASWVAVTNASSNFVSISFDGSAASRFYTTMENPRTNQSVELIWDAYIDTNYVTDGYAIYWSTTNHYYPNNFDVGNQTSTIFTNISGAGAYFFLVAAYDDMGMEIAESPQVCFVAKTNSVGIKTGICLLPKVPVVKTMVADSITSISANLNGQVISTGGAVPATMFIYGTADATTNKAALWQALVAAGPGTNSVSLLVSNLASNTTYYYIFGAVNAAGLSLSPTSASFTTKSF